MSSARMDNFQLYHWAKLVNGVLSTGDYSYAKYNMSVDILKYTEEEYEKHLTDPVHVKPKVPTKLVCAEHLELRKEILTLFNLQKQLQNKQAEASANRESSYAETLDTPKQSFCGDIDGPFVPDSAVYGGERPGKRDHKCKAPRRFLNAPSSPQSEI